MATQQALKEQQQAAHREHLGWLDECGRWRSEHRQALALLAKVQAAILEQEAALESHAALVHSHEMHLLKYKLAGYEPGSTELAQLEGERAVFEQKHEHAREAHKRMAKRHIDIVAEVEKLVALCESGM